VLLLTLVILVVLAAVGYLITRRVSAYRYRNQYILDYQSARYSRDSALKYALSLVKKMEAPRLINRSDTLDFSDIFALTQQEYEGFVEQWDSPRFEEARSRLSRLDANGAIEANDVNNILAFVGADSNSQPAVPGPYGPRWPLIAEPLQFNIGEAEVTITIEDENAKYPLGWAMLKEEKSGKAIREAQAGFTSFCEWMDVNYVEIKDLEQQLDDVGEIKSFKTEFKPLVTRKKMVVSRSIRGRRGQNIRRRVPIMQKKAITALTHRADFAKLFNSSFVNLEVFARRRIFSDSRQESALKYIGIWGSNKVNINSAPRHVLESALVWGGSAPGIADAIIERRRNKPFEDIDELKDAMFSYSDAIRKCVPYITTKSNYFTVRITARSGAATATAVIAVVKESDKMHPVVIMAG